MRGLIGTVLVCVLGAPTFAAVRTGVVVQLDIKDDIDERAMGDQIVAWLGRRDPSRESMAVIVAGFRHARADQLVRAAEAIESCPIPVAVFVERGSAVAPGVLALMLAADHVGVGKNVRLAGDEGWSLPDLCEPTSSGWRGRYEQVCARLLEQRGLPAMLADVAGRPLGDLYLVGRGGDVRLARERNDAEARALVTQADDEHWRVELDRETLIILKVADEADSIGQVLRLGGIGAFKRQREKVASGLSEARAAAGTLRDELRVSLERLERGLSDLKKVKPHQREEMLAALRGQLGQARAGSARLVEIMSLHPEVSRLAPTWGTATGDDVGEHQKRWAREVAELGEELDEIAVALEAIDES
ncbi:MAG: hypothetical protein DYG94_00900 [Leptolyngbya sp. PLA3]|nr:MAG: hypothetical protein EDM82_00975 [Cyanobacteria bacterium CYA]MCE7967291.1 hypothetical protein [Leptolyngbya sp. PL-A3]